MRSRFLILLMSMGLLANTQPYKKEINLTAISEPTLVRVLLDHEIYKHTALDYHDMRLHALQNIEGYFVHRAELRKNRYTHKTLKASSYERDKAKLTYRFQTPFEIEKIALHIQDRNFESLVDVYIDGKLVVQNQKIFDYTSETGIRNFILKIPKREAQEVNIVYHLDKTTSFYKKYQNLKELPQYLTIKSVTFSNFNHPKKEVLNQTVVPLQSHYENQDNKSTTYLFNTEKTPFSKLSVKVKEQNFKRSGTLYLSNDATSWQRVKDFTLLASSLRHQKETEISLSSRAKYLKIVLHNADNHPLTLQSITLFTKPLYLYFIANPKEQYSLYFGDENLSKPSYELESLVKQSDPFMEAEFSKITPLEVTKAKKREVSFFEKYKEQIFILGMLLALAILGYVAFGLLKISK